MNSQVQIVSLERRNCVCPHLLNSFLPEGEGCPGLLPGPSEVARAEWLWWSLQGGPGTRSCSLPDSPSHPWDRPGLCPCCSPSTLFQPLLQSGVCWLNLAHCLLPGFVDKVLLGHSHTSSLMAYLCLLSCYIRVEKLRQNMACKVSHIHHMVFYSKSLWNPD